MLWDLSLCILSILSIHWASLKAMDVIQHDQSLNEIHRCIADDMAQNMIERFSDEFMRVSADNTLVYAKRQSDKRAQDAVLSTLNDCINSNSSDWFTSLEDDSFRKKLYLVLYKRNKKTSVPEQKDLAEHYSTVLNKLTQNRTDLDIRQQKDIPLSAEYNYTKYFVKYNPKDHEKTLLESIARYQGWNVKCGDTFYDPIRQTTYTLHSSDDKPLRIYIAVVQRHAKAVEEFLRIILK